MYTCKQFVSLIHRLSLKGTVTKWHLTYFTFFSLPIAAENVFQSAISFVNAERSSVRKKLLIITSEIGNCIRINKGEITVIMLGLMGSARIIKGRIQRNNTDPLGCAAAPFLRLGRQIYVHCSSSSSAFLMVSKYTKACCKCEAAHKEFYMFKICIRITKETASKQSVP